MKRIAVFASGTGSNAENIINHFKDQNCANVVILLSNRANAEVIDKARKLSVPSITFSSDELRNSTLVDDVLSLLEVDLIVLAGFLLLMPARIVEKYRGRIINIHPALLPAYGGRGMYGMNVHRAVVEANESESGITIHHVDEKFDEGAIIFSAKCTIAPNDTAEIVSKKVALLEKEHFPSVIQSFLELDVKESSKNSLKSNY